VQRFLTFFFDFSEKKKKVYKGSKPGRSFGSNTQNAIEILWRADESKPVTARVCAYFFSFLLLVI